MILKKLINNVLNKFQETKMVIIIRTDLKMGRGKIASQAAHAAVSAVEVSSRVSSPHLLPWLNSGQPKIVLQVDSSEALLKLYKEAQDKNLCVCAIHDAGRSQVASGTLTAVGIGPNVKKDIDELTAHLKLL